MTADDAALYAERDDAEARAEGAEAALAEEVRSALYLENRLDVVAAERNEARAALDALVTDLTELADDWGIREATDDGVEIHGSLTRLLAKHATGATP